MARRKKAPELSEDIEVIGPGQLLSEAREKAGYSQQYVADKLNFRRALVEDIENDIFDFFFFRKYMLSLKISKITRI